MISAANQPPSSHIIFWLRIFFATHLLFSGIRFALFQQIPDMSGPVGAYVGAMADIGLYQAIKYLELIVGTLLLANRFVTLALVAEMPVSVIVFYLNFFISGLQEGHVLQLYTGPQELFLNGILLAAYGGYFANFLRVKTQPWWLWEGFSGNRGLPGLSAPQPEVSHAGGPRLGVAIAVIVLFILVVISGSTGFGERSLRLYDIVPLTTATLFTAATMLWRCRKS